MAQQVKRVSIVIPVFNEQQTIKRLLAKVEAAVVGGLEKEIIVVDDGSTDGTRKILEKWLKERGQKGLKKRGLFKIRNEGKGMSLRRGFALASGEVVIVQDADLEYDPKDYERLLEPVVSGRAKVVYGSRMLIKGKMQHGGMVFFVGGQLINWLTNRLYKLKLTDEATGYKVFRVEVLEAISLKCKRFEFCPEFTAKLSLAGIEIKEIPLTYYKGRTTKEGKKIHWRDGAEAVWTLVSCRIGGGRG